MSEKQYLISPSIQMGFWIIIFVLGAIFTIGTVTGINWKDEVAAFISPSTYVYSPNQNYCVVLGRERYVRKPGETRMQAPCVMDVQNGENSMKYVTIGLGREYSTNDLIKDLPPTLEGKYSLWRRKIYNGEVEQTKIFSGRPEELVARHTFYDSTANPGYMAYFILPAGTTQQCGDNIDLSICKKLLLGEVLWW